MDIIMALSPELPIDVWRLETLLLSLACYLYSSIPFAYLFTYLFKKEHLTKKGTGNIGIANAFGVGGLRAGFLAVVGEATKVILALALSRYYYGGELVISLIFISASILGTGFPIFMKGKGGQGTTILLWALLFLSPYTLLLFSAVFAFTFITLKKLYYATFIGYALLPVEIFLIEGNLYFVVFGALAALFYCLRYKPRRSDYAFYNKNMRLLRFIESTLKKNVLLIDIAQAKDTSQVGMKAHSLWYLRKIGVRVPKTYVCTFAAYDAYMRGEQEACNTLQKKLEELIDIRKGYIVRSSANIEDYEDYSFAGQFDSYLNVSSAEKIMENIVIIWESVKGERVKAYLEHVGKSLDDLKMAVIVQEMVSPEYSGVAFTKNPVSGLDEVVVEAVAGLGSTLMQSGVTPERWIYKWGNSIQKPKNSKIDLTIINQIVLQAKRIERKYRAAVDLEWAYDGENIYWLQLRAITTLKGIDIYSNKISKGFMPGIIKPLIWSVNIPVVNTSWKRLFVEIIGSDAKGIDIHKLARSFYYRAYFNMGIIGDIFELLGMPRELIELLLGYEGSVNEGPKFRPGLKTIKYFPGIFMFALRKSLFSKKVQSLLKVKSAEYEYYTRADLDKMDKFETMQAIEQLFEINTDTSYYVIISQLLMGFYNMMFGRLLKKRGISLDMIGFPQVQKALRDIDPSYQLERLHSVYTKLPEETKRQLSKLEFHDLSELPGLDDFRWHVENFLTNFGHLSDSGNDFSRPQWNENAELVIDMIVNHYGTSPYSENLKESEADPFLYKRSLISFFYKKAAKYRIYRQRVNSLYEYGYGLFRPYFLHLAVIFTQEGYLAEATDIFYLTFDEIKDVTTQKTMPEEHKKEIERRKQQVLKWQFIDLPEIIVGNTAPLPIEKRQISSQLKGVAASKGNCQGRTKLVRGIEDFPRVQDDDILVIPHSDVSWTPIFSKAKAVISESGGMLSHCAIVAREYNIPAVVSVPRALQIPEGVLVSVDGYRGEVIIIEEDKKA